MNDADLEKHIRGNDSPAILAYFRGKSEEQRRASMPTIQSLYKECRKAESGSDLSLGAVQLACLCAGNYSDVKKMLGTTTYRVRELTGALVERKAAWTDQYIHDLLEGQRGEFYWLLIRSLIDAGAIKKPDHPNYYIGILAAVDWRSRKADLLHILDHSPDVLDEDIWKLFEYDGNAQVSLANTDRSGDKWGVLLADYCDRGRLDRQRLLDSSLSALERDFNHFRASWYFQFYDRIANGRSVKAQANKKTKEVAGEPLKQHSQRFLGLLRMSAPNVVAWAFEKVQLLAAQKAYKTSELLEAIQPLLTAKSKQTVLDALKLLSAQLANAPSQASEVLLAATSALAHEKSDVQLAALKLIEQHSSPDKGTVHQAVLRHASLVSAVVRKKYDQWFDVKSPSTSPVATKTGSKKGAIAKTAVSETDLAASIKPIAKALRSVYALNELVQYSKGGQLNIPAATFTGLDVPRLQWVKSIQPITSFDALLDSCAQVFEDETQVDLAEACLDGLARLSNARPDNWEKLVEPLLKRLRELVKRGASIFCGSSPRNDLLGVFYAFATSVVLGPQGKGNAKHSADLEFEFEGNRRGMYGANLRKPIGFLTRRCQNLAQRIVAGQSQQLLSAPTHEMGWIDPLVLADRILSRLQASQVASSKQSSNAHTGPDEYDVILCMLRIAPDHRASALKKLQKAKIDEKKHEWVQAIVYAMGGDVARVGKQAGYWIAAARARDPWSDDARVETAFPNHGPDAGTAAKISFQFKGKARSLLSVEPKASEDVDPTLVTVCMLKNRDKDFNLLFECGGFGGRSVGSARWTASIWPQARESFCAGSVCSCFDNLDWWEAQWQNRTLLEPLMDHGTPLRYAAVHFLTGMLAAKEPGEQGLATDIAIIAVADGRLGSDNFGQALRNLLQTEYIKPNRWAKALNVISQTSILHAGVVFSALQNALVDDFSKLPKNSGDLIELLYELAARYEWPIQHQPCRDLLSSLPGTGKAGKAAKQLLSIAAANEGNIRQALAEAVRTRVELLATMPVS